jgi:hypothetical protein
MAFYFLDDIFEYKKLKKTGIEFVLSMGILVVLMYLIGFFYSDAANAEAGLGYFSTNLNSIVNPGGTNTFISTGASRFLRDFPMSAPGQFEGNAYIGFGMIIFLFIALLAFADDFKIYLSKLANKKTLRRVAFCVSAFILFYIAALSPVVGLSGRVLFTYPIPEFVRQIWSIFRASGRFVWPSVYMIMIAVIWITAKKFKKWAAVAILVVLVVVQYWDMSDFFYAEGGRFREEFVWETNLRSEMWDIIARDYSHFFYTYDIQDMNPDLRFGKMNHILKFAVENDMTVNDAFLTRRDAEAIEALRRETLERLSKGYVQYDKVYIFYDFPVQLILSNTLFVYKVDRVIVGFASEKENAENMEGVTPITPELFEDYSFLHHGIHAPIDQENLVSVVLASVYGENITVCVTNLSETIFISAGLHPVTIGVSLYDKNKNLVEGDIARIQIEEPLRPQERRCFVYRIPFERLEDLGSGTHLLSIRLVQERVQWFPLDFESNRFFVVLQMSGGRIENSG